MASHSSLNNANPSPFGTLDIPGNAALAYRHSHPSHTASGHSPFVSVIPEDEEYGEDGANSPQLSRAIPRRAPSSSPRSSPPFLGPPASALGRRVSVSAESIDPSAGPSAPLPVFQKTPDQMARLQTSIAGAFLFKNLDVRKRDAVLGAMKEMQFAVNERVITQGADGDFFYVVDSGTLDCFVRSKATAENQPQQGDHPTYGKRVTTYNKGGCFGELALMYFAKRAATIITTSPCILWALDRVTFQTILLDISNRTRKSYESFLRSVPILNSLTDQERAKLADVLQAREFNEGDTVVREGEDGREFYIIEEGSAVVYKRAQGDDGEVKEEVVSNLKKGDYFGGQLQFYSDERRAQFGTFTELALLHRAPRAATVRVATRSDPSKPATKLKVAALDGDAFTRLLGPLRELMERSAELNYYSPR